MSKPHDDKNITLTKAKNSLDGFKNDIKNGKEVDLHVVEMYVRVFNREQPNNPVHIVEILEP